MKTKDRILVVEDSRTQALELAETLERAGYEVAIASDGRTALERLRAERPTLVISDVVMPGMNGYELTRHIRGDAALRDLPVILVTSMSDPQDVIRGLECGADGFVLKPLDVRYLVSRIQFLLLNRQFGHQADAEMGLRVHFNGRQHFITADRMQILSLLLSTYEAAVERNNTLADSQQALGFRTAELETTNRFLDSVIENMPSGIFVLEADSGRILRVNRAAEQLLGAPRGVLIGRSGADYFPPEENARIDASHRQSLERRAVLDVPSYEVRALDGVRRTVHVRRVPVTGADGEPAFLIVMCDDITARARAEARLKAVNAELVEKSGQLQKARQEAEAASRAKSDFLAAMSHEIRTPLNGVIGMVDVLHQSSLLPHQVELVGLIRESSHLLLGIIEDILDFSKIEAGRMTIERVPVDVAAIVERACGLLDNLAIGKDVELTFYVDPAVPDRIVGDALRLQQILINLVGNAIKFSSGRAEVRGRVTVRATPVGEDELCLEVTDNGIGMDEAVKARLFRAFEQADATISRRFGGTGLGLAICARLVELMQGRIDVRSAPDAGATFTVRLPARMADPATPSPTDPGATRTADAVLPAGLRCVVVGDGDGLADDHASYLRHAGAVVARVPDLPAARRWTTGQSPGPVVWVLDLGGSVPKPEIMTALNRIGAATGVRILVLAIGRGRRRRPRTTAHGVVMLDGNVLSRRRFLEAVAMTMSRHSPPGAEGAARAPDAAATPGDGASAAPAAPSDETRRPGPVAAAAAPRDQRERILVAEDNSTNRKVIARQLELLDFAADIAVDGQAALERWREGGRYAMVLTDLKMPGLDGCELANAIRQHERARSVAVGIPIVAFSANTAAEAAGACGESCIDEFLTKPVEIARLSEVMQRWIPALDVDVEVLPTIVGPEPAVVAEFIEAFRDSARQLSARIRDGCTRGDAAATAAAAHQFKSACRTVGAGPVAEACEALERDGRAGLVDRLPRGVRLLEVRLQRVLNRLGRQPSAGAGGQGGFAERSTASPRIEGPRSE